MNRAARSVLLGGVGLTLALGEAHSETLAEAFALAYQTNPTLLAQRAAQRALDETYVQARSGWGPTIGITGQAYSERTYGGESSSGLAQAAAGASGGNSVGAVSQSSSDIGPGNSSSYNYGYAAVTVTQPLYTGGKVAAEVDAAQAAVEAGRETLRATENSVLQAVVTAFEDVRRDQQILLIRTDSVAVLAGQAQETQAKFNVGQVTRVDVAQAQAQLAQAQALLATARAQLQISRAEYLAQVGQEPGSLAEEPPLPGLPTTVDQAFDIAVSHSPSLLQAQLTEQASRARITAARASFRPTISAQASYGEEGALVPFVGHDFGGVATGEVVYSQPIFTAGLNGSLVRQALAQNTSDRISIETSRRSVVQTVSTDWENLVGSRASVTSDVAGVTAAQTAFSGIQEQYRVGLSSTLDVLIQQQTLESAQLALAGARHDSYVAGAALLAAIGRLNAADLVNGVTTYDPLRSFNKVRSRGAVPWEPLIVAIDHIGDASSDPEKPEQAQERLGPAPGSTGVTIKQDPKIPEDIKDPRQ